MPIGVLDVVDSHVHFWDVNRFEYPWLETQGPRIQGSFLPTDFAHRRHGVDQDGETRVRGLVVVQADATPSSNVAEAEWFHALAANGAPIVGVVAAVLLERGAGCEAELAELARMPLVSGVRRLIQGKPPGFALSGDFIYGVRLLAGYGLSMDLCVQEHQLAEATELARRCPDVVFVLDHMGKPSIGRSNFESWSRHVSALAALPNVRCKLSGLMSETGAEHRTADAAVPWLRHALAAFGSDRCMFGSDWPVLESVSGYDAWLAAVEATLDGMSSTDRSRVLAGNAREMYGRATRSKGD